MLDVPEPPLPATIGDAVDYAPVCRAAVRTLRSNVQAIREWADHQ